MIEGSGIGMPGWKCSVAGAAERVVKWRMKMAEMRNPVIKKREKKKTNDTCGGSEVCMFCISWVKVCLATASQRLTVKNVLPVEVRTHYLSLYRRRR